MEVDKNLIVKLYETATSKEVYDLEHSPEARASFKTINKYLCKSISVLTTYHFDRIKGMVDDSGNLKIEELRYFIEDAARFQHYPLESMSRVLKHFQFITENHSLETYISLVLSLSSVLFKDINTAVLQRFISINTDNGSNGSFVSEILAKNYVSYYFDYIEQNILVIPNKIHSNLLDTDLLKNITLSNLISALRDSRTWVLLTEREDYHIIRLIKGDSSVEVPYSLDIIAGFRDPNTHKLTRGLMTIDLKKELFDMPLLPWLEKESKATKATTDEQHSDKERYGKMGSTIYKSILMFLNSSLFLSCPNISYKEEEYSYRPHNKTKLRKLKKANGGRLPMYKFINIGNIRFTHAEAKDEDDPNKPKGSPKSPHMRSGHFRAQRYKEDGDWKTKIIFIAPMAIRGGSSEETLVFKVLNI